MPGWNFAEIFKIVANEIPNSVALVQGQRRLTWQELEHRSETVARYIAAAGLKRQDKVAQYLHNTPEYLESVLACFKGSFVPLNTNFRYGPDELTYLWNDGDVAGVVFHGSYASTIEKILKRVPAVKLWLWVDDGTGPCPSWAVPYEDAARSTNALVPWSPDGDDLVLVYTGGTTGMPKGVMWRQDDLFVRLNTERGDHYPQDPDPEIVRAHVAKNGRAHLPAAPLVHGAGLLTCFLVLSRGGRISHLEKRSFDPADLLETIDRDQVASLFWVGDAFARPVLAALEADRPRWNLSSLRTIMSSGVIFSAEVKQRILKLLPDVTIADIFGATESMSLGRSVTSNKRVSETAKFQAKEETRVIDDSGRDVVPGSGKPGLLALGGRHSLGYYKDPVKTETIFRIIDGKRYVVPGDIATIDENGMVKLLGRVSSCINTGGEKVFPEEVETVLKLHAAINDAVVVGIPDDRFGQSIVALVEAKQNASIEDQELIDFVKSKLSGYKAPRHVIVVSTIGRGPNGKADLKQLREIAINRVTRNA